MDSETKLQRLRILIDETDPEKQEDDMVLKTFLDIAGEAVLKRVYPLKDSYEGLAVPDKHAQTQIKIAAYLMNKRGAEGQIQHIENGIHRNYGDADIPESMLRDIIPFAQAIR